MSVNEEKHRWYILDQEDIPVLTSSGAKNSHLEIVEMYDYLEIMLY